MTDRYDVIVVGGGASGMMAAGRAAERGRRVLLLEKNRVLGKKLSITGGGRCNICNAEEDIHRLVSHYGDATKFLYSSFAQFGMPDTFRFFESQGLMLQREAHSRVFPVSEKAGDVVAVLGSYLQAGNVTIKTGATVTDIDVRDGRVVNVLVDGVRLEADSFIIATGGTSHPETGSTGDGFRWLAAVGHTVTPPSPTVVPLATSDAWVHALAGVAFDGVRVTFFVDGKKRLAVKGRVLCTHFGLSGPTILNSAAAVSDMLHDGVVTATIDTRPAMDLGALDREIVSIFDTNKNRDLHNVMKVIAPTGTAAVALSLLPTIDPAKKVHSVTVHERKAIGRLLKALPVTITNLMGEDRAVVTDGGVDIREVDGRTMRSRTIANLYLTGDMLHIRRPSGGYSLQLCWTTGWVAGSSV